MCRPIRDRTMASPLKRVNLMLDESLVEHLRREAREHHMSMSEMARAVLNRELSHTHEPAEILERLRPLRETFGPMPASAKTHPQGPDQGRCPHHWIPA